MQEAEAALRFDMRFDGISFIYPSFYDAEHFPAMIQYKAIEKQPGIIAAVMVEVLDPHGNVDWSSENNLAKSSVEVPWKNSGFDARTNYTRNAINSQDGGGGTWNHDNKIGNLFKFIDPGYDGESISTFQARLTVTLTTGERLIATASFQARARIVAIVNQAKEPTNQDNWGFGPYGKAWIWMTYGLTVDGPAECVNPAENQDKLLLDYQQKDFAFAYTCTTPRSDRLRSIHHGNIQRQIRLPEWYEGFSWGGGGGGVMDVSGFAHAHHITVDFLHCFSAQAAESLADALTGRIGGGNTTVIGYDQTISFKPGKSGPKYGAISTTPELPEDEYNYFCDRFDARVNESLVNQGVCMPENENQMHPWWIADHTIATVVSAVALDQNAIINAAKADYEEHFGKEPTFEATLANPLSYYYTDSGELGPRLYHLNGETEEPVTPSPFTAP